MRIDTNGEDKSRNLAGHYLSAKDISVMIALIKEVRELTQSRSSFAAANELLARFDIEDEDVMPELVQDGQFEH